MKREKVKSDTMASVGYDFEKEILEIEFNTANIYQYFGVPASIYNALMTAKSKGAFFNQAIRENFPYEKID